MFNIKFEHHQFHYILLELEKFVNDKFNSFENHSKNWKGRAEKYMYLSTYSVKKYTQSNDTTWTVLRPYYF